MKTASDWIERLRLEPHPEGGWFREVYRSAETLPKSGLPERFPGDRPMATAIYYLLQAGECSVFHRLRADELWHFYDGRELALHLLGSGEPVRRIRLGRGEGARPVAVVPAGCWMAARCEGTSAYALVGCTVAPGFDFEDLEFADRARLTQAYPEEGELIRSLTRP